jgi:hypothetical protein
MTSLNGGCLCGSIRYSSEAEPVLTAICHCRHCQKQTSAAFSIVVAVPKGSLTIEGPSLKTFDDVGDSGQPVQRNFCGNCGSPITSYVEAMPDLEFIKAGTLDDTGWLDPTVELWCETAQPWIRSDPARSQVPRNPPLGA